jgi:peptidoglycan/LPS O-acetylase OafA/YrhL
MRRVIAALLGVAAGFAALVFWLDLAREGGGTLRAALGVFAGVLAMGFPVLYWCCKRRYWEAWRFLLLGILGGGLCALPFAGGPFAFGFLLLVFLVAGTLLGLLFWLVAIHRNTGLTCPKSFCLPCGKVYKVARNALGRR